MKKQIYSISLSFFVALRFKTVVSSSLVSIEEMFANDTLSPYFLVISKCESLSISSKMNK
jgi:hypothetical protein